MAKKKVAQELPKGWFREYDGSLCFSAFIGSLGEILAGVGKNARWGDYYWWVESVDNPDWSFDGVLDTKGEAIAQCERMIDILRDDYEEDEISYRYAMKKRAASYDTEGFANILTDVLEDGGWVIVYGISWCRLTAFQYDRFTKTVWETNEYGELRESELQDFNDFFDWLCDVLDDGADAISGYFDAELVNNYERLRAQLRD